MAGKITFEEFQKSKRDLTIQDVANLNLHESEIFFGFIYLNEWWIAQDDELGFWTMMYNEDFASIYLEEVEQWLFDRVKDEID